MFNIYSYTVNEEVLLGINFRGLATPTKIKPAKSCTDEELATVITILYPHPLKFIPTKI